MNHIVTVGVTQRVRHLAGYLKRVVQGELLFTIEPVAERLALDIGHNVIEESLRLARVVQRQDVRMGESRRGLDLPQEPLGAEYRAANSGFRTLMATWRWCLRSWAR